MNAQNFTNPNYLRRIKAAILRATRKAASAGQVRGTANEVVYNRRENPSLVIVARAGRGFEIFGGYDLDDDVTGLALAALRDLHANQRQGVSV